MMNAKLSLLPKTIIFTKYLKSDDLAIVTIDMFGAKNVYSDDVTFRTSKE